MHLHLHFGLPINTPASVTRWLTPTTPVTVTWVRDLQMNTLAVTDPMSRKVESYRLDAQDRVIAVTNLESQTMAVSYLLGGLVSSVRRFDGVTVSNVYDRAGRVNRTLHNGATSSEYAWRANGQPLAASNATARVSWGYDAAGRGTSETQTVAGAAFAPVNLTCAYDPAGNVTNTVIGCPATGFSLSGSCTYDAAERLDIQSSEAGSFTNLYGDWNGLSVRVNNAALTEERAFDILDRMTNLVYRNASAAIVGSFSYRYDVLGLVTQKIAFVASGASSVTNIYAYDKIGRLTNEITRSSSGATTTRFTYDLAGNRLTAGASTYTYANNRLNGALHDTAGNITNLVRGTTTLRMSWNTLGQLVSVATNNILAESYAYDPLGRRVKTTAGGTTVYHVYSGDECAADLDASGNPLRSYTFGQGIDNLLAVTVYDASATNTCYAVKDHLGSVQALVNVSGSVVESYSYDAWGNTTIKNAGGATITSSAYGNRYMFQGREYSTVTGLYNFRARWYAPTIGRWLSKDPIGLEGGLNLYAFCGNNAVNFVDPQGLAIWIEGPSGSEPTNHQSINIGNPFGKYRSYSYGTDLTINLKNYLEGQPYKDTEKGGVIEMYKETTPCQDAAFERFIKKLNEKSTYGIDDTCRTWSQRNFDRAPGNEVTPPSRTPAKRSLFRRATSSSASPSAATSFSGTGTLK